MGPFELVDLVGLDVRLKILEYLHRDAWREVPAEFLATAVRERRAAWPQERAAEFTITRSKEPKRQRFNRAPENGLTGT